MNISTDCTLLIKSLDELIHVDSAHDLGVWVSEKLLPIFEPSAFVLKWGRMQPKEVLRPIFVTSAYPESLVDKTKSLEPDDFVPLLPSWKVTELPMVKDMASLAEDKHKTWYPVFQASAFKKVCVNGCYDIRGDYLTYICMTDPNPCLSNTSIELVLSVFTPVIHTTLCRLRRKKRLAKQRIVHRSLTPREVEILDWVKKGKTNEEISSILGISFHTIKNHVQSIMIKLRANNRAEAVGKAFNSDAPNSKFMDTQFEFPIRHK